MRKRFPYLGRFVPQPPPLEHHPLPEGICVTAPPRGYGAELAPLPEALARFSPDHALLDLPCGGTIGFFRPDRVSRHFLLAEFCDLRFDLGGPPLGLRAADLARRFDRPPHPDWVDGYQSGLVREGDILLWNFWGFSLTLSHGLDPLALDFTK